MVTAIVLLVYIGALLFVAQYLQKRRTTSRSFARKVLHIGAISACALAVLIIPDKDLLLWIAALTLPFLAFVVWKGFFKDPVSGRRSWGIFYFAAVYVFLLLLFRHDRPELVFYPMLVLAFADGFATVIGEKFGSRTYLFSVDSRTLEGSLAFFFFTILCLVFPHAFYDPLLVPFDGVFVFLFVAMFLTLTESVSSSGRDNIWVPLGLVYWVLVLPEVSLNEVEWTAFLLIPLLLSLVVYKLGWLQLGGSVAALMLGWIILISPDPRQIIPALFFFVIGSMLTKLPGKTGPRHFGNRSAVQVFSNGGMPVAALMGYFITQDDALLFGFYIGFTAALSDTASSEIGTRLRHPTFNVITGRGMSPGMSGGISWSGLISGLFAAMLMAAVIVFLSMRFEIIFFFAIAILGLLGNVLDSIFGAWLQVKYRTREFVEWADEPPTGPNVEVKGLHWVSNDMVNLMATGMATLIGIVLYNFL